MEKKTIKNFKKELIAVEFYPDGTTVRIYKDDTKEKEITNLKPKSPKDLLNERLKKYKEGKK